ncbi:MAG: phosphopantetheine-binding protein [Filomicrobium sp.]
MRDGSEILIEEDWLLAWFSERADDITLHAEDNYFDKGVIDSFGAIELIEAIETHFTIQLTEHDFQDRRFTTINGLAAIIRERNGN